MSADDAVISRHSKRKQISDHGFEVLIFGAIDRAENNEWIKSVSVLDTFIVVERIDALFLVNNDSDLQIIMRIFFSDGRFRNDYAIY